MDTRVAKRIEGMANVAAAVTLAVAVAFALSRLTTSAISISVAAAGTLLVALYILRSIGPDECALPIASFEPAELVFEESDELLLTEAICRDDVLVLDDVLNELGDDSRVVRLFDPSAIPTPGQLRARVDQHLARAHAQRPADASGALHDALAELRRSLK